MIRTLQPFSSTIGVGSFSWESGVVGFPSGISFGGNSFPLDEPNSSSISRGPSQSGSANKRVTFRKSITAKWVLPSFSRSRVPRPMICLNSVIEPIISSKTISLVILQSAPVERSLEVVAITGYFWVTEENCLIFPLPISSLPVIRTT